MNGIETVMEESIKHDFYHELEIDSYIGEIVVLIYLKIRINKGETPCFLSLVRKNVT